jgi:hypothetical protein
VSQVTAARKRPAQNAGAMKKISTPYNASFKIFPFVFYGILAVFLWFMWMGGVFRSQPVFLIVPVVMSVVGYFFMKVAYGELVDEVFDCGSYLLARKGGIEEHIPLQDIINVGFEVNQKPARIRLTLAKPCRLGNEVTFALPPRFYFSPIPRSEIAEDLIYRVHQARQPDRH